MIVAAFVSFWTAAPRRVLWILARLLLVPDRAEIDGRRAIIFTEW